MKNLMDKETVDMPGKRAMLKFRWSILIQIPSAFSLNPYIAESRLWKF